MTGRTPPARTRGISVALIGPDGAGKSTIGRRLAATLPMPARYLYMGVNLESSNMVLPTTRLYLELKRLRGGRPDVAVGPPAVAVEPAAPPTPAERLRRGVKGWLRLASLAPEEWFRQLVIWWHLRRGRTVILDRHFYADYYFHDVVGDRRTTARRLHGYMLARWYPKPDLFICLDASAQTVFARKPEGSIEALEQRRREYLALADSVPAYERVDADGPLEDTLARVREIVLDYAAR